MNTGIARALRTITSLLEKTHIAYMVVGSFASMVHGEPRTTQDLDLVIDPTPSSLDAFLSLIDMDAFYVDPDTAREALRRRTMFNIVDMSSAWKLDLVIRKDRPFSVAELARRSPARILEIEVPTASAEDTIVAKLEWAKQAGSDRQLRDVAGIVRVCGENLDRAYIERWVGDLGLEQEWARALTHTE